MSESGLDPRRTDALYAVLALNASLLEIKASFFFGADVAHEKIVRWKDRAVRVLREKVSKAESDRLLVKTFMPRRRYDLEEVDRELAYYHVHIAALADAIREDPEFFAAPLAAEFISTTAPQAKPLSRRVFVVHGHNEGARESVARFLEKLDLAPVILHEQATKGKTLIEKLSHYSDVAFAVVLLTDDDRGGPKADRPESFRFRARQNVLLELGYFIALLGRANVCPLYVPGVEIPSDYSGVGYVALDKQGSWKMNLARELNAAGLSVDMNKAI